MKITITNTFHGTSVNLIVADGEAVTLSEHQVKRAEKELCGMADCQCGALWKKAHTQVEVKSDEIDAHFEPVFGWQGHKVVRAELVEDFSW